MSNIGFIYKISNSVDDEVYVGSTKQTLYNRYHHHLHNTKSNKLKTIKLYEKMNAVGKDKFKVELLETVQYEDKYDLYAREQLVVGNMGYLDLTF